MEQDQRLTPLPKTTDINIAGGEYPPAYSSYYDNEAASTGHIVKQYLNIVYKRLPLILTLAVIVTAAAAFYMYRQPSVYQSSIKMVIEPKKPRLMGGNTPININFGADGNYFNTQLMLLRNPDLMTSVVKDLELYKDPALAEGGARGIGTIIKSVFSSDKNEQQRSALPVISTEDAQKKDQSNANLTPEEIERTSAIVNRLAGGLSVDQLERTNLVTISVQSRSPQLSAAVANKLGEVFIKQNAQRESQGARQALESLRESIDGLTKTIEEQELDLIATMKSSDLPLAERGGELSASRLQTVSEQWLTAMDERRRLEARYNAALQANKRGEGMNIPDLNENKVFQDTIRLNTERKAKLQDQIRDIEKQIQEAEAEKAQLLVKYTPDYYKVKEKVEKIASLTETKNKTEKEVSTIIERDQTKIEREAVSGALVGLRSQLDAALKREGQLRETFNQESSSANIQGQAQTQLTTKKRELEQNRKLLDDFKQEEQKRNLEITDSVPDNLKITANAVENTSPVGPARGRNILVALLISLIAGVGLAFLLDYLDDSVKSSDDIGRSVGLPTLALIPHHNILDKKKLSSGKLASSTALITLEERQSPIAEAYRHLRTSLLFSSAGKPPQSILVTSSQPSEGKTTTAINTAITLAQAGVEVVIIDCDLRRPRIHNHFNMDNSVGLTNYLSGDRDTQNLIKINPELPNLKVITSGPIPPNPAELLSSNEMKNLIQFLRGKYKHIVVDSPPAISFTDAAILSTLVDGVILVAMAGKSSAHLMRRFKHRMANIGARIYGVVLNGLTSGSAEYEYYGSGYYNYYGKGRSDEVE